MSYICDCGQLYQELAAMHECVRQGHGVAAGNELADAEEAARRAGYPAIYENDQHPDESLGGTILRERYAFEKFMRETKSMARHSLRLAGADLGYFSRDTDDLFDAWLAAKGICRGKRAARDATLPNEFNRASDPE